MYEAKNWTKDDQQLILFVSNVYIYSFQKTLKQLSDKRESILNKLYSCDFNPELPKQLSNIEGEIRDYSNDLIMTIEDFDEISCSYRETTH